MSGSEAHRYLILNNRLLRAEMQLETLTKDFAELFCAHENLVSQLIDAGILCELDVVAEHPNDQEKPS